MKMKFRGHPYSIPSEKLEQKLGVSISKNNISLEYHRVSLILRKYF
jgi:hypothetical protein